MTAHRLARHIVRMAGPSDDTDAGALRVLTELYREMSPEEKLRRVRDLTLAASQLALMGLRGRHPRESDGELLLRLARLRLGTGLVEEAYGAKQASR